MKKDPVLRARLRVLAGLDIAIGPGKAELLGYIAETGSLRQAAARLGMSYMRAWSLVRLMNRTFRSPLVESLRGGRNGGGARLTPRGVKVLALYRGMEARAQKAAAAGWLRLRAHLK